MTGMVTLRCPEGGHGEPITDEGNRQFYPYRVEVYSADPADPVGPWNVDVPAEAAPHFISRGFTVVSEEQTDENKMVRLRSPSGGGCVWGDPSKSYEPDADGIVTVPAAAVSVLTGSMGFVVVPDEAKKAPEGEGEAKTKTEEARGAKPEHGHIELQGTLEPEEEREDEHEHDGPAHGREPPRGGRVPRR